MLERRRWRVTSMRKANVRLRDGRHVYVAWFAAQPPTVPHRVSVEFASAHPVQLLRAAVAEPRTEEELLAFLRADSLARP
jgi:hypothetical protein